MPHRLPSLIAMIGGVLAGMSVMPVQLSAEQPAPPIRIGHAGFETGGPTHERSIAQDIQPTPANIEQLPATGSHEEVIEWPGPRSAERPSPGRPRIGVVLGGGGAAGVCHVGVLKVLEEYGIPVDCIAGTSMGSIVAGLYATGMSAKQLETIVYQFPWDDVLVEPSSHAMKYERRKTDDYLFPPAITMGIHGGKVSLGNGFVSGQNLTLQLRRLFAAANLVNDFDQLPIPFRTVATDLETGDMVVFRDGNLATAVRASMSIPGVFPPVRYNNRLLIDGGVRNNVPVDLAREMGADIVIVVVIPPDLKHREDLKSLFAISSQALTIMATHGSSHMATGLTESDVLIEPNMKGIGSLDFGRAREGVALGVAAARQKDARLRDLARLIHAGEIEGPDVGPGSGPGIEPGHADSWQQPTSQLPPLQGPVQLCAPNLFTVGQIQIHNDSPLATDESIASRLTVRPTQPFSLDQLERDVDRLYGTGSFGNVDYELGTNEYGEAELDILTTPDTRGDNLLTLGLSLEEDFSGDSFYTASASYVARGLNSLGGEARVVGQLGSRQQLFVDFFQPLEESQQWFARPYLQLNGYIQPLVIDGQKTAEYLLRDYQAGMELGRTVGDYGVITAGTLVESSDAKLVTGPAFLDVGGDYSALGGFYLGAKHDSLDNYFFPTRGVLAEVKYTTFANWFGSEPASDIVAARFIGAASRGPHIAILRAEGVVDSIFSGATLRRESTTGGFLRLSGYSRYEIFASRRVQAALVYMRQIKAMMGTRVKAYCGMSLEAAYFAGTTFNAPENRPIAAGSAFLAVDTPIGPIFAGYGIADTNHATPFIAMGQVF